MLTTMHVVIISNTPAFEAIRTIAANSPAEATMPMDIRPACRAFMPMPLAVMPRAKDTAKYPMQIGMPSRSPRTNQGSCAAPVLISCVFLEV